jgi:hypothetical protein
MTRESISAYARLALPDQASKAYKVLSCLAGSAAAGVDLPERTFHR